MLRGDMCGVYLLLGACSVMLGTLGQTVDKRKNKTLQSREAVRDERGRNNSAFSTEVFQAYVRQSESLSAEEKEFIQNRKKVALKALNNLGVKCSLSTVPHIALLPSGGGQRAAVSVMGTLRQLDRDGLLDAMLYLGGVSGSTWSMAMLYAEPMWSEDMDRQVSRLSGPLVNPLDALAWLRERVKEEHFSLSDMWGLATSTVLMRQLDPQKLSELDTNVLNPYPIFSAVDKNCLLHGPTKGRWFELTPHESGFTDLGQFINSSMLGSRIHEIPDGRGTGMDMVRLQGILGSVLADEMELLKLLPDWLSDSIGATITDEYNLLDVALLWTGVGQKTDSIWQAMGYYMRGYSSLFTITEVIKRYSDDPAVLYEVNKMQKIMKEHLNLNPLAWFGTNEEHREQMWQQLIEMMVEPLLKLTHCLEDGMIKDYVTLLVGKVIPLILRWEWGTTENFLYDSMAAVPPCISQKEHLQLIDAGIYMNVAYPPFLGGKRDMDVLVVVDYGSDVPFTSLTLARDYAAEVKKPFPKLDDKLLEDDKEFPRSLYVFDGKGTAPTIVYLPFFNRDNCKDAAEVKAKMEEFSTFQPPLNQERMNFLLETAGRNVKINKQALLMEINKAVLRRRMRRNATVSPLNFKTFKPFNH
ncbi:cytosolic phospholipase A2 gamma-like [Cheilinus undulatus]|uniref:cytosolic phospholipase A2 gamma-like n=1 Tax=Cheilinus undulatus TaxID=241271 RepID=UPI001BD27CFB|nr:cytosolic phospholipase A2 gamma-like [Cheilinus undulatus]